MKESMKYLFLILLSFMFIGCATIKSKETINNNCYGQDRYFHLIMVLKDTTCPRSLHVKTFNSEIYGISKTKCGNYFKHSQTEVIGTLPGFPEIIFTATLSASFYIINEKEIKPDYYRISLNGEDKNQTISCVANYEIVEWKEITE